MPAELQPLNHRFIQSFSALSSPRKAVLIGVGFEPTDHQDCCSDCRVLGWQQGRGCVCWDTKPWDLALPGPFKPSSCRALVLAGLT